MTKQELWNDLLRGCARTASVVEGAIDELDNRILKSCYIAKELRDMAETEGDWEKANAVLQGLFYASTTIAEVEALLREVTEEICGE